MKKIILLSLLMLILIPSVFSIYGGETWVYHFDECEELIVNITATDVIDTGEYTILNNCTENQTNYFLCECNDNYDFNITFNKNTVNNYTIYFNYKYSKFVEEPEEPISYPRRGGGYFKPKTENQTEEINQSIENKTEEINQSIITEGIGDNVSIDKNATVDEPIDKEKKTFKKPNFILPIIIALIVVAGIIIYLVKKGKKE